MFDPTQFLKVVEEFVFELSALVMMNGSWKPKSHDKVIIQFVGSGLRRLIPGGVCLGKSGVVIHDYQYVLVSTRAWFEMNIVHGDELERCCGEDRLKWCVDMSCGFTLLQATTHFCDIMGDVCSHKRPIEAFSS